MVASDEGAECQRRNSSGSCGSSSWTPRTLARGQIMSSRKCCVCAKRREGCSLYGRNPSHER